MVDMAPELLQQIQSDWSDNLKNDAEIKSLIEKILKKKPAKIIYISCGPDTLQRDLKLLSSLYKVTKAQMFDLFPSTSHFESITYLEKRP